MIYQTFLVANLIFDSTILDFGNKRHVLILAEII